MELFANDKSIHEQFYDIRLFRDAVARLMAMRNVAQDFDREIYSHGNLLSAKPMPNRTMQQAVQLLTKDEQRSVMSWLTRGGPFWDDISKHRRDDRLECRGEVVTESAVGEAAYRKMHAIECSLVSLKPSDWDFSPVSVTWRREESEDRHADVDNWRDVATLEEMLCRAAPPIRSWDDLRTAATRRFRRLIFSNECFRHLDKLSFAKSSADRIIVLCEILNRFAGAFDADGIRSPEGQKIYQDFFTGENALFSDSSSREKRKFRDELSFPHPANPNEFLFCTWHGKERHLNLRLHFSWPLRFGKPVYIVYAGPKLTKR